MSPGFYFLGSVTYNPDRSYLLHSLKGHLKVKKNQTLKRKTKP